MKWRLKPYPVPARHPRALRDAELIINITQTNRAAGGAWGRPFQMEIVVCVCLCVRARESTSLACGKGWQRRGLAGEPILCDRCTSMDRN